MATTAYIIASCENELAALKEDPAVKAFDKVEGQVGQKGIRQIPAGSTIISSMNISPAALVGRKFYSVQLNLPYADTEEGRKAQDDTRKYLKEEGTVQDWKDTFGYISRMEIKKEVFDIREKVRARHIEAFNKAATLEDYRAVAAAVLGIDLEAEKPQTSPGE